MRELNTEFTSANTGADSIGAWALKFSFAVGIMS